MKQINSQKVIERLKKNGWSPVNWSHHPEHIKKAIKAANFRPAAKSCFANAQKLVINQNEVKLTYVEGIIQAAIPILHAWVRDENNVDYDITLGKMYPVLYSQEYSNAEIRDSMIETGLFCPVNIDNLNLMQKAIFMGLDTNESNDSLKNQVNDMFKQLHSRNESLKNHG